MRVFVAFILALVIPLSANAEDTAETMADLKKRIQALEARHPESFFTRSQNSHGEEAHRFQPYRANYFLFSPASEYDDDKVSANYSFRYSIFDCRRKNTPINIGGCGEPHSYLNTFMPAIFLSYTGAFDFYMGSRPSGPVVNRVSNPAIHLYSKIRGRRFGADYLELAFEHRSNGQVVEVEKVDAVAQAVFDAEAQMAFDNGNHAFFDTISRESNFFNLTFGIDGRDSPEDEALAGVKISADDWPPPYRFNWQLSLKAYTSQGNVVTWGDMAGEDVDVDDYDLARVSASKTYVFGEKGSPFNRVTLSAEYTVGDRLFETDSFDVALVLPYNGAAEQTMIPLVFKLHHGPMETLSDYTKPVTSFGVGLAFWY